MSDNRRGLSKKKDNVKLKITIDENINGKDIVLAEVNTDKGTLPRFVYSKSEHFMSIDEIKRKLKPKEFIIIKLIKKVGESIVEPKI